MYTMQLNEAVQAGNIATEQETTASPNSTSDAEKDTMVAQRLVKIITTGMEAQNIRTHKLLAALKRSAIGNASQSTLNKGKVLNYCSLFDIPTKDRSLKELAGELADRMLDDMNRTNPGVNTTLEATAPPERKLVWDNLNVSPAGTAYEMSRTAHVENGDLRQAMDTISRLGTTFLMNSLGCASIAQDCLFGLPQRVVAKANPEALESNSISIVISVEDSQKAKELVATAQSSECVKEAILAGAEDIRVYAVSATNPSDMEPVEGVIPLSHIQLSSLFAATGAIDLWLTDPHNFSSEIMEIATAKKTVVVATEPLDVAFGTESIDLSSTEAEKDECSTWAKAIVTKAIENYYDCREIKRHIPSRSIEAVVGFNLDTLEQRYGCMSPVASALITGQIKGIVNLTASPDSSANFDRDIAEIADILLSNNILIFANGHAAVSLVDQGYCSAKAIDKCGTKLQRFLGNSTPVWHFSNSIDSLHVMLVFREIAKYAGRPIRDLPFAELTPHWSDEQDFCIALAYRMLGLNSYHCADAPIQGGKNVQDFLYGGSNDLFGSRMIVDPDPKKIAEKIVFDFEEARSNLCWR